VLAAQVKTRINLIKDSSSKRVRFANTDNEDQNEQKHDDL
jgi:hypothetical protein